MMHTCSARRSTPVHAAALKDIDAGARTLFSAPGLRLLAVS
jgi:hypothetical protein